MGKWIEKWFNQARPQRLRKQLEKAAVPLKEYGIKPEDLAAAVALRLGIEDQAAFSDVLFSED